MVIKRVKINEILFNAVYAGCYDIMNLNTKQFTFVLNCGRTQFNRMMHIDRKTALFCEETQALIVRKIDLVNEVDYTLKEIDAMDDLYIDIMIEIDHSATSDSFNKSDIPWSPMHGKKATKIITKDLLKYYTEEELEECYRSHEFIPQDKSDKEIHEWIPAEYQCGTVYKLNNCVKYDINSAYLSMLSKVFPKAANYFVGIRNNINKYKKAGNKDKVLWYKNLANYFVGNMVNDDHEYTRAWIVKQIREQMDSTIEAIGGELIYANTDGFIVHNPDNIFTANSKKLGEFKYELYNHINSVYIYLNDEDKHHYQLIQYRDTNNEIATVGTIPLSMRIKCNLEEGTVVDFEETKDVYNKKEYKIKEITYGKPITEID